MDRADLIARAMCLLDDAHEWERKARKAHVPQDFKQAMASAAAARATSRELCAQAWKEEPAMSDGETEVDRERCASCRYFKAYESGQGACRRRAPVLIQTGTYENNAGQHVPEYLSAWPMMDRNEWCGDYDRKAKA